MSKTIILPPPSYSYDIRNLYYEKGEKEISTHASHLSRCSRLWGMALADPYTVMLSLPEWAHGAASTGIVIEPYVISQLESEVIPAPAQSVTGKTYTLVKDMGNYTVEIIGTPDAYYPEQKILVEVKTTTSETTTQRVVQGDIPWPWLIQLGTYAQLIAAHYPHPALDKLYTACYSTTTGEIYVNEHDASALAALVEDNERRLAKVFSSPETAKAQKCDDFWGSCLCSVLEGKRPRVTLTDYSEGEDREIAVMLDEYLKLADEASEIEKAQKEIREKLSHFVPLGTSLVTDQVNVSHHVQSTKRCNYQLLQARNPELYKEVVTVVESPRLTIRRKGDKNG